MKKLLIIAILFTSCNSSRPTEFEYRQNEGAKHLVFQSENVSVYKITVDSVTYLVAEQYRGGISIIRTK